MKPKCLKCKCRKHGAALRADSFACFKCHRISHSDGEMCRVLRIPDYYWCVEILVPLRDGSQLAQWIPVDDGLEELYKTYVGTLTVM